MKEARPIFHLERGPSRFLRLIFVSVFLLPLFVSYSSSTVVFPSPSAAAVESLRTRGYTIFSAVLENMPRNRWNFTGSTVLAPSDAAFFSVASRFKIFPAGLSRSSISVFLFHTIRQPLRWQNLTSLPDGAHLPTFYYNRCLYLRKNLAGEVSVAGKRVPSLRPVKIVRPDLYIDGDLVVHGIDGVLDHSEGSTCPPSRDRAIKNALALDRAVRALRLAGYRVVAMAMEMRRKELTSLPAVTVLAPTDDNLLIENPGVGYDLRYHVIPRRFLQQDLIRLPIGARLETLLPAKKVSVDFVEGVVLVNGVGVGRMEVYRNAWLVVLPVSRPLKMISDEAYQDSGEKTDNVRDHAGKLPDLGRLPDEGALGPAVESYPDYLDKVPRSSIGSPLTAGYQGTVDGNLESSIGFSGAAPSSSHSENQRRIDIIGGEDGFPFSGDGTAPVPFESRVDFCDASLRYSSEYGAFFSDGVRNCRDDPSAPEISVPGEDGASPLPPAPWNQVLEEMPAPIEAGSESSAPVDSHRVESPKSPLSNEVSDEVHARSLLSIGGDLVGSPFSDDVAPSGSLLGLEDGRDGRLAPEFSAEFYEVADL